MKGAIVPTSRVEARSKNFIYLASVYLLQPFKAGLYGFAAFFTVLMFTRALTTLFGLVDNFVVSVDDVYFSLLGFVLVFVIRMLENVRIFSKK